MRGLSPLISVAIMIVVVLGLAVIISPWAINLTTEIQNTTADNTIKDINCRSGSYGFVTSYGTNGLKWNISGSVDSMTAMIENTGTIDIYNFTFVATVNSTADIQIYEYPATSATQKTSSSPLKPGSKALLNASITDDSNGSLSNIRIINSMCPTVYAEQDL